MSAVLLQIMNINTWQTRGNHAGESLHCLYITACLLQVHIYCLVCHEPFFTSEPFALLVRLRNDNAPNARENAAEVLAAIARAQSSPLTSHLGRPAVLRDLMHQALAEPRGIALVQAGPTTIPLGSKRTCYG